MRLKWMKQDLHLSCRLVGMSETEAKKIMGNGTPKGVGGSASEHTMNVNFDSYRINLIYSEDLFNRTIIAIRVTDSIY